MCGWLCDGYDCRRQMDNDGLWGGAVKFTVLF